MKKSFRTPLCILLAVLILLSAYFLHGAVSPSPADPPFGDELLSQTQDLDEYTLAFALDLESLTLSCTQEITFQNRGDEPLSSVCLRTWANAFSSMETSPANTLEVYAQTYGEGAFSAGGLEIYALHVNGQEAAWDYELDDQSLLRVLLPEALDAGKTATLLLDFTLTIPECAYSFGKNDNVIALKNAFPVLATDYGEDGDFASVYPIGNVQPAQLGNWRVSASLPEGWMLAGGSEDENGGVFAPGVRGFDAALVYAPHTASALCSDTLLSVHAQSATEARRALKDAKKLFESLENLYGDYPRPTLDLVKATLPEESALLTQGALLSSFDVSSIAYGLARQWFGFLAASDSYDAPFLSDGLSSYAALQALKVTRGEDDYLSRIADLEVSMLVTLDRNLLISSPAIAFMNLYEYEIMFRERCPVMLHHLSLVMGEDELNRSLAAYVSGASLSLLTRADFENAIGQEWTPFLSDYLDTAISAYF